MKPIEVSFPTLIAAMMFHLLMTGMLHAQYDSTYFIVDTGQMQCYNNSGPLSAPSSAQAFYGQDAQHAGNPPQYRDNGDGTYTHSSVLDVVLNRSGDATLPLTMEIQNYPHPFNPSTRIAFLLPQDGVATLTVIDMLGREIVRLVDAEQRSAGWHEFSFSGEGLPSGRYTCQLVCGNAMASRGMQLLK